MTNTIFNLSNVLNSDNMNSQLADQWIDAMEQEDLNQDAEWLSYFLADDVVRDALDLAEWVSVSDDDRLASGIDLTLDNMCDVLDYDALGEFLFTGGTAGIAAVEEIAPQVYAVA